jgi:low temperature requirement protein LtrA
MLDLTISLFLVVFVLFFSMLFGCYATCKREIVMFLGILFLCAIVGKGPTLKSFPLFVVCSVITLATYHYKQKQNKFSSFVQRYIHKTS